MSVKYYSLSFDTPIGKLCPVSDGKYITEILFGGCPGCFEDGESAAVLQRAKTQINEYLAGKRTAFDLPIRFIYGTPFQKDVWNAIKSIPYGQTASYGSLAVNINRPRAYRAVGTACSANTLPLIIPCHRVVASRGEGGFTGGMHIKRFLLNLEEKYLNLK